MADYPELEDTTPEQRAANQALTEAIDLVCRAYGFTADGMVNMDYMVLMAQQGFDPDGSGNTGFVTLYKDGEIPWTSTLALVYAARLRVEHEMQEMRGR